jgi:hypothetical protein
MSARYSGFKMRTCCRARRAQAGAVELRPTFEHTDPVLQHGRLPSWDQVLVRGRSKELKARALKLRVRDGVLGDQPGGLRSSFADQALRRPSDLGHDRLEPQRILLVNGGHTWIIALVQRSRRRQLVTDRSVVAVRSPQIVRSGTATSRTGKSRLEIEEEAAIK